MYTEEAIEFINPAVALQHDLNLANARIKELDGVNLALIAERDKLRAECDLLEEKADLDDEVIESQSALIRNLKGEREALRAELDGMKNQEPVAFGVFSDDGIQFSTSYEKACHEHINDAINEFELDDAAKWKVRKLYVKPMPPAIPKGIALVPAELTAENGAKAALIGEKFAGEYVSWSAIKEVHRAIVKLFAAQKGGA